MGPLINPGKVCLSKIWKTQIHLQRRKEQTRFDLKEKKNHQPLANRRNQNKPIRWADLQKNWPQVSWDNNLNELNLDDLPEEEKEGAMVLVEDIRKHWFVFQENLKDFSSKRDKKKNIAKIAKKIIKRMLIVMSDASGGLKYTIYGAVAYLRYTYEDKTFRWILVAASSKVAADNITIVVKELKGIKLASELGKRISVALDIDIEDIFYHTDNTILMDQISGGREKGVSDLSQGFGNLIAKVAIEIPEGHRKFAPSKFDSADNLTREKAV